MKIARLRSKMPVPEPGSRYEATGIPGCSGRWRGGSVARGGACATAHARDRFSEWTITRITIRIWQRRFAVAFAKPAS